MRSVKSQAKIVNTLANLFSHSNVINRIDIIITFKSKQQQEGLEQEEEEKE